MKLQGCIPAMFHFLPGCGSYAEEWQKLHPAFMGVVWTAEKLDELLRHTPGLCQLCQGNLTPQEIRLCHTLALLYAYGGICVTVDTIPKTNIQALIKRLWHSCIILFGSDQEAMCLDVVMSAPRVNTWPTLFMTLCDEPGDVITTVSNFFVCTAEVSGEAVKILPTDALNVLIHRSAQPQRTPPTPPTPPTPLSSAAEHMISEFITNRESVVMLSAPRDDVRDHGATESAVVRLLECHNVQVVLYDHASTYNTTLADICVIDSSIFNTKDPVPYALQLALQFQEHVLICNTGALIVIGHMTTSLGGDMMVTAQLQARGAIQLTRGVWRLN